MRKVKGEGSLVSSLYGLLSTVTFRRYSHDTSSFAQRSYGQIRAFRKKSNSSLFISADPNLPNYPNPSSLPLLLLPDSLLSVAMYLNSKSSQEVNSVSVVEGMRWVVMVEPHSIELAEALLVVGSRGRWMRMWELKVGDLLMRSRIERGKRNCNWVVAVKKRRRRRKVL